MHGGYPALTSTALKWRRDARLIELCLLSRRHIAEITNTPSLVAEVRSEDLPAIHRWREMAETLSQTRALTFAGIKAKTMVCNDIISKFEIQSDAESHVIRSLFRDILNA